MFELLNIPGILGGGEKLYLIDLLGIGGDAAFRTETGFHKQDVVMFAIFGVSTVLYWFSKEDDLDWEALLGDDDDDEESEAKAKVYVRDQVQRKKKSSKGPRPDRDYLQRQSGGSVADQVQRKLKETPPTNLIQATHVEQAQELIDSSGRSAMAIIADLLDDGLVNFSVGDFTSSESVSKMQGALDVVRRTGRNPLDIIADLLDDGILNMSAGSDSRGVSESVPTQYLYPTPDDDTGLKDKMEAMGSIGEWRKFADTGIFQDGGLSDCRRIRHDEEGVLYVKLPKASQEGALITEIHTTEAISESGLNLAPEVFHADSSIPVLVTRQSGDFTLKSFLEHTGSLDVSPKAAFIARLCSDVREMHEGGWVHRDIKPGNITIEDHVGGQSYHGLIDFGSAKRNNRSQGESTHFTEWWCHKSQADPSKRAHYGQDWFSVGRLAMLLILGLGDTIVGKRTIQSIAEGGNLEGHLAKGLEGMPDWQDYDSTEGILDLMLLSHDDQASLNELRKLGARVGT